MSNIEIAIELIRNLPADKKKNIIDMLYQEDIKETLISMTRQLDINSQDINLLKISGEKQDKRIIYLENIEKERKEIFKGWKEASTIAAYLFPGNTVLKTLSGQQIGIFYFAFGLRGKNGIYSKKYISGQREEAIRKDSYFYQDEKRLGSKMSPYWPGNVRKIKELFDKKLQEAGFFHEFYNAKDIKEVAHVAVQMASERLNKHYNCMINLQLPPSELMREFKKNYKLGDFDEDLTDIELN
jgi:hypothetical protein